jgi:hypothetical protein
MALTKELPFVVDYDLRSKHKKKNKGLKISPMKDSEEIMKRMLTKIITFWRTYSKYVDKRGYFKECELKNIQDYMTKFDKYFQYLKVTNPDFKDNEDIKQSFFLNLVNFLTLYKLSVLLISNPEAIEKLNNFNMW